MARQIKTNKGLMNALLRKFKKGENDTHPIIFDGDPRLGYGMAKPRMHLRLS